jgi:phosphatidylglycerophosphatase A
MGVTALATGLYLSYIPSTLLRYVGRGAPRKWTGAGFIGTLEGLALAPLLPASPWRFAGFLAVAVAAAAWICGRAERELGGHDDPRIVLDEVVGFWTAIAGLPATWTCWLAAFAAFRLLDSVKLPPYRWLEKLPGGWGVVMDDVGAGVCVNILIRILMMYQPGPALS